MTKTEIADAVSAEYERMAQRKRGICADSKYRMGKINGMLFAFELVGDLTRDEALDISIDVWEG